MNSGIKNILYFEDYPDETTGVIVKLNNSVIHKYKTYYFISKKNDHIFGFDKIFQEINMNFIERKIVKVVATLKLSQIRPFEDVRKDR